MNANVTQALRVLDQAVVELGKAISMGFPTAVAVVGVGPVPEVTQITAQWRADDPTYQDKRQAVAFPQAQYENWRAAWDILVAYAGWWGPRARWPLGDGVAALKNKVLAGTLPPIVAGLASIQGSLVAVRSPGWTPDVNPRAILSLLMLLGGSAAITYGAKPLVGWVQAHLQPRGM